MKKKLALSIVALSIIFGLKSQDLTKDTIALEEVVITGNKTLVTRNNVPLSISTINNKDIENTGESALLPVISEMVPGVFVTERGITGFGVANGAAGQISIRGIGGSPNTQVLMLLDGHPQYMGIMGHPLPDAYVASDVEKVEVVRGPASILYGSGAMGGVINIITKKQKSDGITLNGRITYGSFNTQKYMGSAGFKHNKLSVFASFNHDYTDGHRKNSSFEINNGYVKADYTLSKHLKASADYNIAKFMTYDPGPAGTNDSTFLTAPHWIDILRGKASASIENSYDKINGAVKVFHNYGEHKLYDGFHSNDINQGIMVYQSFTNIKNNTTTVGIDYKTFGGLAENTEAMMGQGIIFGDTTLTETGIYLLTQQKFFGKLIVNAGLRSETHSVYGNELIPQFGASYTLSKKTTIKAVVSKGFRSPTIRELYLWAPANDELLPERMMNHEISLLQKINDNIKFELTGFYIEGSNLIKTVFEGGIPKNINTGEFSNSGIEFSTNVRLKKELNLLANYSFLHMKYPVIASPEQQAYLSLRYTHKNLSFNINTQYINGLYTLVAEDNSIQEDYILLNAKVNYSINKYVDVFVSGNNLLDTKYEINYDYPMPGINFFAGLNLKFNKPLK